MHRLQVLPAKSENYYETYKGTYLTVFEFFPIYITLYFDPQQVLEKLDFLDFVEIFDNSPGNIA